MAAFRGKQTLQTMCLFKLVNELENYTPDAIFTQLPPTLRRMLLLNLPALDIIRLESTSVARGINMNIVWEKVCKQKLCHPVMLNSDYRFDLGCLHYMGSWKEHYLAIVTSIILNVFKGEHELHCARGALNLLFCYVNFLTLAKSIPGLVSINYPELLLIVPHRYTELQEMLDTPSTLASFLMKECHYRPKLVYVSCSLFFYSPFWKERDSCEVSSTFREFLGDTRQIVFSTDSEVVKRLDPDDEQDFYEMEQFHLVSRYVMEMILSSNSPQLESVLIDNNCSVVLAARIIRIICDLLCEFNHESLSEPLPFHTSIPPENLLRNVPYKYLKGINFSTNTSDPREQLDGYTAARLASAVESQINLETVQLSGWPCDKHFTDTDWYDGEQKFTHLLSVCASLFKQPQFQRLELEVTSVSFSSLQGILHLFFTAISSYHQTLKLNSITIFQQNMMPGTHVVPGHNTRLLKSLHLSNMELTPSQETLIFSYPLLQLESLTLINMTSVLSSKSLGRDATLLQVSGTSNLRRLVLKDVCFDHQASPRSVISLLLQSPNLTHLELEHCDIDPSGLVTSLSREIPNYSDLRVLKFAQNQLGKQTEQDIRQLCKAIFSLPHASNLKLDVSANDMDMHHFTILLDTWKQHCSGKKLNELVVSENDLEPGLSDLANIAHRVVF